MSVTVLLLDRQVATRRMLRFALELQNVRIIEADDAAAALAILERGGVDLLTIGFEAPDEENLDVIDRVRSLPKFGELPILLVGDHRFREFRNLRDIGCCAWLDKPLQVTDIHTRVNSLLGSVLMAAKPSVNGSNDPGHV